MKQKRAINNKLLKEVGSRPCYVCNYKGSINNDAHHVKSKKSGGEDVESNLVSLCRKHHQEIHQYGINKFCNLYPKFSIWLSKNDWYFCPTTEKWKQSKGGNILGQ